MIAAPFALIRSPGHINVFITNVENPYVLVKVYSTYNKNVSKLFDVLQAQGMCPLILRVLFNM